MNLARLRWLTIVVPLVFLAAVDVVRHSLLPQLLHPWPGYVIILAVVTGGVYLFSRTVFDLIERTEAQLVEQTEEARRFGETAHRRALQLRALHAAGLSLASNLNLETVLQQVVDLARELTGARYGALGVFDDHGRLVRFITSGIGEEERARIGAPPRGRGLLGAALQESAPVRVDDIARDPRSVGFPDGHPTMTTFLGVPVTAHGRTIGNLYLTDKQHQGGVIGFSDDDEEIVQLFAVQAAVAIENARLHAEVQGLSAAVERERIARELHDSLAQVLGYVRLRATTAGDALRNGSADGVLDALDQIAHAATDAYADVREAILGLRTRVGAERDLAGTLAQYLDRYRLQTGLAAQLVVGEGVVASRLAPDAEVQLLRIIQEALANVRKHAAAREVTVRLSVCAHPRGPRLRTVVADDGRGFDVADVPDRLHFGLATMRERAQMVGGSLAIESTVGSGTRVIVDLPLDAAPDDGARGAIDATTAVRAKEE